MMILGENVNTLKIIDSSLRLIVVVLSLGSTWLTLTNHQNNEMYGNIEFSNLKGLKFLVVAYLMVASGGSFGEIVYLAYNGNPKVTWSEACSSYGRFCGRLNLILALHLLLLCFVSFFFL